MKIKLSNYVSKFLVEHGVTHAFTVTGGGAMHLNDSLGHQEGLTCVYNHHEQACAIAAESYGRIHNTMACCCVTTGPGGTNAMTGVVGAYLDSIPMIVISGQVRYDTTARSTGLNIRAMGDQEFDIVKSAEAMTKYAQMVEDPKQIRYCLEKAFYIAKTGRPGPCWIDIPVNFQGFFVETDELEGFDPAEYEEKLAPHITMEQVDAVIDKIKNAQRPVFYAGNGIRISGGYEYFKKVVGLLNIPVATGWDSIDAIYDEHPLYVGRGGIMGDRAGNFAVQNSDLVFAVGNRLSIRQVGYNWTTWAREAYVIMNDVCEDEMKKPTLHVDMPVWGDAKELLMKMAARLEEQGYEYTCNAGEGTDVDDLCKKGLFKNADWIEQCIQWKKKYPVVLPKHYEDKNHTNVYAFIKELSNRLEEGQVTVVGNGSACVVGSHAYVIKKNQRFIINSAIASMGYDLPAAIGAAVAEHGDDALYGRSIGNKAVKDVILVTGDGSIQMNIQELQTIIHHKMPIKIFLINNEGYHSIRQTQTNLFNKNFVGIGPQSGDLSFPDMSKLAPAYGYPYMSCDGNEFLGDTLEAALAMEGPVICEIFCSKEQLFEPKSATKRLEDGTLVSPPLEDLGPFLDRDEFYSNMIIKPIS
ncbi:MAG: thiamine pyrophosphate-binding protein [Eubacteriales bacterium]|nr:thiamine pyrophosphate-binding protein [Eubacteriales bacterium]